MAAEKLLDQRDYEISWATPPLHRPARVVIKGESYGLQAALHLLNQNPALWPLRVCWSPATAMEVEKAGAGVRKLEDGTVAVLAEDGRTLLMGKPAPLTRQEAGRLWKLADDLVSILQVAGVHVDQGPDEVVYSAGDELETVAVVGATGDLTYSQVWWAHHHQYQASLIAAHAVLWPLYVVASRVYS